MADPLTYYFYNEKNKRGAISIVVLCPVLIMLIKKSNYNRQMRDVSILFKIEKILNDLVYL